jgi:hypothetical protein
MSKDNKFDYILVLKILIGYYIGELCFDVIKIKKNIVNLILIYIILIIIWIIAEEINKRLKKDSKTNY